MWWHGVNVVDIHNISPHGWRRAGRGQHRHGVWTRQEFWHQQYNQHDQDRGADESLFDATIHVLLQNPARLEPVERGTYGMEGTEYDDPVAVARRRGGGLAGERHALERLRRCIQTCRDA